MRKTFKINSETGLPICPECKNDMEYAQVYSRQTEGSILDNAMTMLLCVKCGYNTIFTDYKIKKKGDKNGSKRNI